MLIFLIVAGVEVDQVGRLLSHSDEEMNLGSGLSYYVCNLRCGSRITVLCSCQNNPPLSFTAEVSKDAQ